MAMERQSRLGWTLVTVVVVVGLGVWLIMGEGQVVDVERGQGGATATTLPGFVKGSPPAGRPTLHAFGSGAEVVDYVRARVNSAVAWETTFVARTTMRYFEVMVQGGGRPIPTPASTEEAQAMADLEAVVWVVGFRANVRFGDAELSRAMGFHRPDDLKADTESTEGFVVMDEIGNFIEVGTLDDIDANGTAQPFGVWQVEDIQSLPTASP